MILIAVILFIAGIFIAMLLGDDDIRESFALFIKIRFLPWFMPYDMWMIPIALIAISLLMLKACL